MKVQKEIVSVTTEIEAQTVLLCDDKLKLVFLPNGAVTISLVERVCPSEKIDTRESDTRWLEFDLGGNDSKILYQLFSQAVTLATKSTRKPRAKDTKDTPPSAGDKPDYVLTP